MLVDGVNVNDNETRVSLGKPAEDVTKELEEGGIGVKAKEKQLVAGGGSRRK